MSGFAERVRQLGFVHRFRPVIVAEDGHQPGRQGAQRRPQEGLVLVRHTQKGRPPMLERVLCSAADVLPSELGLATEHFLHGSLGAAREPHISAERESQLMAQLGGPPPGPRAGAPGEPC